MEHHIYSNNNGEGFSLQAGERLADWVTPKAIEVAGTMLEPGELTNMQGFFDRQLKYEGILTNSPHTLVFCLGTSKDLLSQTTWYATLHRIHSRRLFRMYTHISGRDFNWIRGQWK